ETLAVEIDDLELDRDKLQYAVERDDDSHGPARVFYNMSLHCRLQRTASFGPCPRLEFIRRCSGVGRFVRTRSEVETAPGTAPGRYIRHMCRSIEAVRASRAMRC